MKQSDRAHSTARLAGVTSLNMPLLLHVDAVDGVLGLMIVAVEVLRLLAVGGDTGGQTTPITVSSRGRSGELVLEEASV